MSVIGIGIGLGFKKGRVLFYPGILDDGNTVYYDYKINSSIIKDWNNNISRVNNIMHDNIDLEFGHARLTPDGIYFDNIVNAYDYLKTNSFLLEQPFEVYIYFKQLGWNNSKYIFDGNAPDSTLLYQAGVSPELRGYAGKLVSTPQIPINTFQLLRIKYNGSNSEFQLNDNDFIIVDLGNNDANGFTLGCKANLASAQCSKIVVRQLLIRKIEDDVATKNIITNFIIQRNANELDFNEFHDYCDGYTIDTTKWDVQIENEIITHITQDNAIKLFQRSDSATAYSKILCKSASKYGIFNFSVASLKSDDDFSANKTKFGLWASYKDRIEFFTNQTTKTLSYRIVVDNVTIYQVDDLDKDFIIAKIIITQSNDITAYYYENDTWNIIGVTQNVILGRKAMFMDNTGSSKYSCAFMRDVHVVENDFTTPFADMVDIDGIDIRAYGAIPDGSDSTAAINSALTVGNVKIENGIFHIGTSILIPSNRKITIKNAKVRSLDGTYDNIFRNSDLDNGNTNINIIGLGNALVDGNHAGNYRETPLTDRYKAQLLFTCRLDIFEIGGLICVDRPSYFATIQDTTNGIIRNIHFNHYNLIETLLHHDGIQLIWGTNNIELKDLSGWTGDDFTSIYVGQTATLYYAGGSLTGDVHDITYLNFDIAKGRTAIDMIINGGNKIYNLFIDDFDMNIGLALLQFGYIEGGASPPLFSDLSSIIVNNMIVHATTNEPFQFVDNCSNITITNTTNNTVNDLYLINSPSKVMFNVNVDGTNIDQN